VTGFSRNATDESIRAWLKAGPVDRGVGDGLTFFAKEARDLAGKDRALLQQGVDVGALKRQQKLKALDRHNVEGLAQIWQERRTQTSRGS
jgi:hypothetical protein